MSSLVLRSAASTTACECVWCVSGGPSGSVQVTELMSGLLCEIMGCISCVCSHKQHSLVI